MGGLGGPVPHTAARVRGGADGCVRADVPQRARVQGQEARALVTFVHDRPRRGGAGVPRGPRVSERLRGLPAGDRRGAPGRLPSRAQGRRGGCVTGGVDHHAVDHARQRGGRRERQARVLVRQGDGNRGRRRQGVGANGGQDPRRGSGFDHRPAEDAGVNARARLHRARQRARGFPVHAPHVRPSLTRRRGRRLHHHGERHRLGAHRAGPRPGGLHDRPQVRPAPPLPCRRPRQVHRRGGR